MSGQNDDDDEHRIATLQRICEGITVDRAEELLEAANGNLERAIDIFFHQQPQEPGGEQPILLLVDDDENDGQKQSPSIRRPLATTAAATSTPRASPAYPSNKKRLPPKTKTPSPAFGRKQARLDSFFGAAKSAVTLKSEENPSSEVKESAVCSIEESNTAFLPKTTAISSIPNVDVEVVDIEESTTTDAPAFDAPFDDKQLNSSTTSTPLTPSSVEEPADISFQYLADTLQQLSDTTKRLVKLDVLKTFILHIVQHPSLAAESKSKTLTCGLLLLLGFRGGSVNQQAPMDVGGSALSKALQTILGTPRVQLSKAYRQYGDMGDAAASLFQKKTFFVTKTIKTLTLVQVYESLEKIVGTEGRDAKQHILLQLLRACNTKMEIRFLVRLLIGNMRVGANLKTVLAALAMSFVVVPEKEDANDADAIKRAVALVQKTHDLCPNLQAIIEALLKGGLEQVPKDCSIQLLTPIAPMLAHPIHSLEQVAKAMGADCDGVHGMTMEWKYDGVRCQAHYDGTTIKLFSRHMLETTEQYPDAAKGILNARRMEKAVESFIMDAEIVGVEGEGDELRLLPFQDLSRRKKKNDNGQGVRVKVFAFDLMFFNGVSCMDKALAERQVTLREFFAETDDFAFVSSQSLPTFDEERICAFLEQAVEKGAEGLMLKMLGTTAKSNHEISKATTSPYEAGTRSHSWLKVKRDYVAGYADTIDVVPIGAWYGHGRKAQKSFLSPVLLAVYDEEEDVYRSISRCMSFTDSMYEAMREFYFRGTPYPANVGIEASINGEANASEVTKQDMDVLEEQEEDADSDSEGEDEEQPNRTASQEGGGEESLVNCYANRPSSAYVITNESPPIWFKPMEVFEVSFADMSLSRQHTAAAGLVDDPEGRGVALRFPRFKRRRPDKRPDQATTSMQIAQLFAQQSKQGSSSNRQNRKPH